ncbi:MAG: HAMP domain-containing sensor histidine kinase, partial [Myxococcota bacterium]
MTASASQVARRDADPRLVVELRLLAMTGFLWTAAAVQAAAWTWATDLVPTVSPATWATVAGVQLLAFYAVAWALVGDMPSERWPNRSAPGGAWATGLLLLGGAVALPVVPVVLVRARRVARASKPDDDTIGRAALALLQLPRTSSLRLLGWTSGAFAATAVVLGLSSDWPRDVTAALLLLWLALLGPVAAIAYGWSRAILRPETMAAPPRARTPFARTHDMRLRLIVSASIASAGAIVAPLSAGYLWLTAASLGQGDQAARMLATEAALSAAQGDGARLTALLADNPSLTLLVDGQAYGAVRARVPTGEGAVDDDGDGAPDAFVARHRNATAVVGLEADRLPTGALWFTGLACLGCCVLALSLVASDLQRDVMRANEQVKAVAEGRAPPPMSEASVSSFEIRELVQSVDRLVGRITEANVAKYIAIEKAREADRLKSQFLANMSHDLRSPLNSVLGFSELLISGIDGEVTAEQREFLEVIHDSGRHLLQEIDDILDTAKIEAGRLDLHSEPTPPATLLTRAIQNAKRRGRDDIEYRTVVAAGLPPTFVDPYRGVQALENVLLFAAERMEGGALEIAVRRGVSEDRRMVFFSIRTPVRPATAEQLAEARRGFYRIPGHRGLGLGLPIAGSIVELSGGSMGIEDLGE